MTDPTPTPQPIPTPPQPDKLQQEEKAALGFLGRIGKVLGAIFAPLWKAIGAGFDTIVQKLLSDTIALIIVVAAITGLLLYFAGSCSGSGTPDKITQYEHTIQSWKDSTKVLIEHKDSALKIAINLQKSADSLTQDAAKKDTAIKKLNTKVRVLQKKADSLFAVATHDSTTCINLCNMWKTTASDYKNIVQQDSIIISQDSVRYAEQVEAYKKLGLAFVSTVKLNDDLSHRLETIPAPPHEEKFLGFIPMPSRKSSFVVGIGVGVVATSLIISSIHK